MPRAQERYCARLVRDALGCAGYIENYRFNFLRGDKTLKRPKGVTLPVDAYYPDANLVLEFREGQHYGDRFSFRDGRITATGQTRKEQRLRYDKRREAVLPARGVRLLIIYDYQLVGDYQQDLSLIRQATEELLTGHKHVYHRPSQPDSF